MSTGERPRRSDARRNRERVLAAARDAFAEAGFGVPLDVIAARAGVGPGTVYRHFPTKEALFAAVTQARTGDLVELARTGAASDDPGAAFDAFLARLADEATVKRDVPDVLDGAAAPDRGELHAALGALLVRAQEAGAVRAGIGVTDLLALVKGLLHAVRASDDAGMPARLLDVVRAGLHPETDADPPFD